MLLWSHEIWQFQLKVHGSKLYFLHPTFIAIKNIKLLKININTIADFGSFVPKTKWSKYVTNPAYITTPTLIIWIFGPNFVHLQKLVYVTFSTNVTTLHGMIKNTGDLGHQVLRTSHNSIIYSDSDVLVLLIKLR